MAAPELVDAPSNFKSKIWNHFGFRFVVKDNGQKETLKDKTTCKLCFEDVSYKAGNTSNMAHHMKRHHSDVDSSGCSRQTQQTKPNEVTYTGQLRLQDAFLKKLPHNSPRAQAITRSIGTFLAMDMRPYSLVQSNHFKSLINCLDPKYQLPSRIHFSHKVIPDLYNEIVTQLKEKLRVVKCISLTTDGWTSRSTQSYITITVHYVDLDWKLQSAVLQTRECSESHTAENLAAVLKNAVKEWKLERKFSMSETSRTNISEPISNTAQLLPIAITSDNAQNIVKAIKIAEFHPHIRCFAHCLNLAAQKGMDIPAVSRLLGRMRRVVTFFHQSSTATKILHDKQKALDLPAHKLIQDVKTRWNSSYDMMERYLEQQPAIYATLRDNSVKKNIKDIVTLSDDDIKEAESLVVLLKPLKTITTLMCNERSPTVSMIHPLRERLVRSLMELDSDSFLVTKVKDAIRQDITSRYTEPDIVKVLEISCALDPRFHTLPFHDDVDRDRVYDAIIDEIKVTHNQILIKQEPSSCNTELSSSAGSLPALPALMTENYVLGNDTPADPCRSPPKKKSAMEDLFGDVFVVKETPAISLSIRARDEIQNYRMESPLSLDSNPLQWWGDREERYPLLSGLAVKYLCIQGTSVPSERVFSTAGDIVTAQRSLLDPDSVDKLIFLKKNLN